MDDPDAFLAALRPHYDDALRYGRGLWASGSPADVEDAFQSALLRAAEGFAGLRDPELFRPWLFRIVTREVRRAQRRRPWRRLVPLPPDDLAGPLGLVASSGSAEALDLLGALARLGRREREALLLFEVGGFTVDEIRDAQGDRSASAVKSRLSRARASPRSPPRPRALPRPLGTMTDFDALRPATPDSFDRAAALLRQPRARPARRRALVVAAALAAAVGACAVPVEAERTVGTVVSWTAYGLVGPGNYKLAALDAAVAPPQRLAVETRSAERPDVPPDHDYPAHGTWTRVRYTTATVDPDSVAAFARALRAVVGVYNLHVEPLVHAHRVPLAAAVAGRVGVAVNPGDPSVSDSDLQTFVDGQIERLDRPLEEQRFPPRVERLPDGRRILREGSTPFAYVLTSATRIWIRPDAPPGLAFTVDGISDDGLLFLTPSGWRSRSEGSWGTPIDDLPPAVRDSILRASGLDKDGVRLD